MCDLLCDWGQWSDSVPHVCPQAPHLPTFRVKNQKQAQVPRFRFLGSFCATRFQPTPLPLGRLWAELRCQAT